MKSMRLCSVLLLTVIGQIKCGYEENQDLAQSAELIPLKLYPCKDEETSLEITVGMRNIDDDGNKVLDVKASLEQQLTHDFTVVVKIDQWKNGAWEEDVYNGDGKLCEFLERYVKEVWRKLRELISPAIPEDCDIAPGDYALEDYEVILQDVTIPVTIFGTLRVTLKVFDTEEELFVCHMLELEVNKK